MSVIHHIDKIIANMTHDLLLFQLWARIHWVVTKNVNFQTAFKSDSQDTVIISWLDIFNYSITNILVRTKQCCITLL